ncbi:hypothetical protein KAR91_63160, partial [Candidatus Pacearchaeota archaeon]|nr:hypothetical protein [Candidatus Pacearchaeota archaeon]
GILSNSASGAITITNNHLAGNTLYDIQNYGSVTPNISFNTFETCYGISPSSMIVKAAGTPWDGSCI